MAPSVLASSLQHRLQPQAWHPLPSTGPHTCRGRTVDALGLYISSTGIVPFCPARWQARMEPRGNSFTRCFTGSGAVQGRYCAVKNGSATARLQVLFRGPLVLDGMRCPQKLKYCATVIPTASRWRRRSRVTMSGRAEGTIKTIGGGVAECARAAILRNKRER